MKTLALGGFIFFAICMSFVAPLRASSSVLEREVGPAVASESSTVSVHLALRNGAELDALLSAQTTKGSPFYRHWLTPAQFRADFGTSPQTIRTMIATLEAAGLTAAQTSSQMLTVSGPASAIESAFKTRLVRLKNGRTGATRLVARSGYTMPLALERNGATVLGLRRGYPLKTAGDFLGNRTAVPANRNGEFGSYWADDLKQAYQYPSYRVVSGKGVNVAFVAGGDFSDKDLDLYLANGEIGNFAGALAPRPSTRHQLLPGARRFDPNSIDSGEANLDSQQIAMQAPGATLTIFVTPDDSDGAFIDAYTRIVESNVYDIVSTSYSECELFYTAAYNGGIDFTSVLSAFNEIFKQGNAQGTTFVAGSGDEGALGCPEPGYVLNPPTDPPTVYKSLLGVGAYASLPTVVAVGGGELKTKSVAGSVNSTYTREVGMSDRQSPTDPYGTGNLVASYFGAGGGISQLFKKPAYQKLVDTGSNMRTVPDVGGHVGRHKFAGDTLLGSSDIEVFNGQTYSGVLGTSASAPDFAALLALKVETEHSRLGLENDEIYELASHNYAQAYQYFHDGIPGYDGFYSYSLSHRGYNYIYGNGSPRGAAFLGLQFSPFANDPQSASNP